MSTGIVDYGLVSSLGVGKNATAENLFSTRQVGLVPYKLACGKNSFAGLVSTPLPQIPEEFSELNSRNNQLIFNLFLQIEKSFLELKKNISPDKIGIVIGTSTSGIYDVEEAFKIKNSTGNFPSSYHYKMHEMGSPAEFLANLTQCNGPAYTVSCACSSGAKALASASRLLENGVCDLVIAGGVDTLCQMTLKGFNSLEVISEQLVIPFSKNRRGINLGEGGALFLLTKNSCELKLLGYGESSDAYHHSSPHPDGIGAVKAMEAALSKGSIKAEEVNYINLHGTGTIQNDAMEAKAIANIFSNSPLCSSTKSLTGHTLGAAGALEAAFSLLVLEHQKLPIHHWDEIADETLPGLNFVKTCEPSKEIAYILSNSYAFGGNNCSLLLGKNSL